MIKRTLLRGPEEGARRTSRLRSEERDLQVSAAEIIESDGGGGYPWALQIRVWARGLGWMNIVLDLSQGDLIALRGPHDNEQELWRGIRAQLRRKGWEVT